MATVWKTPSGRYRVRIRRRGLPAISKTFTSRSTAQAWARKTESEVERSVYLDLSDAQSITLARVLTRYSDEVAVTHKGWRQEQSRAKGLSERLGDQVLTDLTPSVLADYREERLKKVGPKTVREELSLLQRVFNVCLKDWGITLPSNANPLDLVRKPRGGNSRERRLSQEEYGVISQVPISNWAIETAMRRGEIAAMDWRHVELEKRKTGIRIADPSIAMGRRDSGHICSAPTGSADDPKPPFAVGQL